MTIPGDRGYSESHQWARADDHGANLAGITDHAQQLLGDLVFVESPALGRNLKLGEQCGEFESFKSASDIYAPVSGEVSAVIIDLDIATEIINQNAYEAWIFKFKPADPAELVTLLDAEGCRKHVEAQV